MNNRELRKLSRIQLLELLIQKSREADALRSELEELRAQTQILTSASALAEAANRLSGLMGDGIFAPASSPAGNLDAPETILSHAQAQADALLAETRAQCAEMLDSAQAESQHWWEETARKLDALYESRPGLRELVADTLQSREV